jgi:hypothetical protein
LTGLLTLDGPANGLWIFKVGTLGTGALTGTNFSVVTKSGTPPPCNSVYWWVAEGVTATDSTLVGTILAGGAVILTRGTFNGDAFASCGGRHRHRRHLLLGGAGGPPACTDADRRARQGHGQGGADKNKARERRRDKKGQRRLR